MRKFLCVIMLGFLSIFTQAFAENSPIPMLEETAKQIIAVLNQNKAQLKSNPKFIYQTVEKYLLPCVDVQGMARSVLGRLAWNKATMQERADFTKAFTRLVIRTYSTPLAEYTDEKIQFLPLKAATTAKFLRVQSKIIRSSGQIIPLNYSLVDKNGAWKIYDLSVEGVSLLQSFRNQFAQVLQNSNMQTLIQQMNQVKHKAS